MLQASSYWFLRYVNESLSVFRGRHHALVSLSKQTVAVFCNEAVKEITNECGNNSENGEQRPRKTKIPHYKKKRAASEHCSAVCNVHHGVDAFERNTGPGKNVSALRALNAAKFEFACRIPLDQKTSPGAAETAYAVKEHNTLTRNYMRTIHRYRTQSLPARVERNQRKNKNPTAGSQKITGRQLPSGVPIACVP